MSDEMDEIRNDFLVEAQEMLEVLDQRFVALETDPANKDLLNEIFRAIHSMKGSAGFLGFQRLVDVTHRAESILNKLRQGEIAVSQQVIDIILEAVDLVRILVADIRESGTDVHVETGGIATKLDLILEMAEAGIMPPEPTEQMEKAPVEEPAPPVSVDKSAPTDPASPRLGEILVQEGLATKAQIVEALDKQEEKPPLGEVLIKSHVITEQSLEGALQKQAKSTRAGEEDQTIRVETKRLDSVMNLVGELVLGRNRLMKLGSGLEQVHETDPMVRELCETLAQINLVTSDLQLAVMKTRMVPIRKVLGKFPRMVRDLSQKLGKQVRLELQGEDTELDKSVADEMGDPLVHLVRNAVDHGIETPAVRHQAGKPVEGVVRISASQEGNSIVIRIQDDGRGLQLDKIKAKAVGRGLVTEADLATMDQREIFNLIFLPGFSTAEQVTDVSGRGVGMDVVRTNIRKINGAIDIESEPGHGSTITIKLPLTIAIIQALLVEVGRSTFAIPLSSVVEAVKISQSDIKTVNSREVLNLRERVLPLLRLAVDFDLQTDHSQDKCYVVVSAIGERQVGVVVDRLRSQEEVVIKSLGDYLTNIKGVAGATITGEGKVVLILDLPELVQYTARCSSSLYA